MILIKRGKKITITEVTIRGSIPKPNQRTRNGARATEGMVFAPIKYGIKRRERNLNFAIPNPTIILKEKAMKNPPKDSTTVNSRSLRIVPSASVLINFFRMAEGAGKIRSGMANAFFIKPSRK
jgi:hypothetical protein